VIDPLANPEPLIRRVYAYAAYRLGAGADAEDVTSDTLERALRYRGSFDPRKGQPATWLLGIARRCVDEHLARRQVVASEGQEEASAGDLEAESVARVDLARALARLEPRDQELLALRYGADLTARQIGELLGLQTNAAEVALHRALERLRAAFRRQDGGGSPESKLDPVRV